MVLEATEVPFDALAKIAEFLGFQLTMVDNEASQKAAKVAP